MSNLLVWLLLHTFDSMNLTNTMSTNVKKKLSTQHHPELTSRALVYKKKNILEK